MTSFVGNQRSVTLATALTSLESSRAGGGAVSAAGPESASGGLHGGVIAGIGIGGVVVLGAGAGALLFLRAADSRGRLIDGTGTTLRRPATWIRGSTCAIIGP